MTNLDDVAQRLARIEIQAARRGAEQKEQHRANGDRLARIEGRLDALEKWKWILVCTLFGGSVGVEPLLSKLLGS